VSLKVLILTHRVPFPLNDGGALATYNLIEGLAKRNVLVDVLSCNTAKHLVGYGTIAENFDFVNNFETVFVNNNINIPSAAINLFNGRSYHISRFETKAFEKALQKMLKENAYDWVIVDHLFLSYCLKTIRQLHKGKVACRIHNIEHLIWEKLANNTKPIKAWYLKLQARRLKQEELQALNKFDSLLLINKHEGDALQKMGITTATYYLPFNIDHKNTDTSKPYALNKVYHLGSMNWRPNVESLDYLLNEIWPLVLQQNDTIQLYFGGYNMPDRFKNVQLKNVHFVKHISEANVFMRTHGISLVPLKSGAGVRIKIIQAFANAVPVIATSIGAAGINYTDGENIVIANDAPSFAQAIIKYATQTSLLGSKAYQLFEDEYASEKVFPKFISYLSNG
jgi:polysaccharide biosynthesis protein PslH